MSTLADFVVGNVALGRGFEPFDVWVPLVEVFLTGPAVHALSPQVETAALKIAAHQIDDVGFRQSELLLNGFKRGAVLPSHFDDPVQIPFDPLVRRGLGLPCLHVGCAFG